MTIENTANIEVSYSTDAADLVKCYCFMTSEVIQNRWLKLNIQNVGNIFPLGLATHKQCTNWISCLLSWMCEIKDSWPCMRVVFRIWVGLIAHISVSKLGFVFFCKPNRLVAIGWYFPEAKHPIHTIIFSVRLLWWRNDSSPVIPIYLIASNLDCTYKFMPLRCEILNNGVGSTTHQYAWLQCHSYS